VARMSKSTVVIDTERKVARTKPRADGSLPFDEKMITRELFLEIRRTNSLSSQAVKTNPLMLERFLLLVRNLNNKIEVSI
jgi:hypothetical protein